MLLPEWSPAIYTLLFASAATLAALIGLAWIRAHRARSAAEELSRVLRELRCETESAPNDSAVPSGTNQPKKVQAGKSPEPPSDFGSGLWRRDGGPAAPFQVGQSGGTGGNTAGSQQPLPTLISIPCLDGHSEEDRNAAVDSLGRRHAAIWEMARGGHSIEEITKATGQPIGEIEVILNLQRQIHPHESAGRSTI